MTNFLIRLAGFSPRTLLIFGVILAGIYYSFLFDDGSKIQVQIDGIQKSIQEQEAKAKEADAALKEVEEVRATVGALSEQFKTVSQALPSEVQMSDIIRAVDTVSRASGVSIKTKEPQTVLNRDYYEEIPLRIIMEGTYSEITMFLYYLASTERIMKVNNFVLAVPATGDKVSPGHLLFDGQVVSYRFITNPIAASGDKK